MINNIFDIYYFFFFDQEKTVAETHRTIIETYPDFALSIKTANTGLDDLREVVLTWKKHNQKSFKIKNCRQFWIKI
jgi:hypothetical protein